MTGREVVAKVIVFSFPMLLQDMHIISRVSSGVRYKNVKENEAAV